jgi:hypothetical protein
MCGCTSRSVKIATSAAAAGTVMFPEEAMVMFLEWKTATLPVLFPEDQR